MIEGPDLTKYTDHHYAAQVIEDYLSYNEHMVGAVPKPELLCDLLEGVLEDARGYMVEWAEQTLGNLGTCECLSPISVETLRRGYCAQCSRTIRIQVRRP